MQPYFLPYLEHFRLIAACDRWVVFDTVKYSRHSWMNRNRIINREKGWTYLGVPVSKPGKDEPVSEVRIAQAGWPEQLFDKLRLYEKHAPHYPRTVSMLRGVLGQGHERLVDLNVALLRAVCGELAIATPIECLSELKLELPGSLGPGEWALWIAKALGASEYRNPSGGKELFDAAQFEAQGIRLSFHEHRPWVYSTRPFEFQPDLSIVDPLMWAQREAIREQLLPTEIPS
jgi:hypothetical protein